MKKINLYYQQSARPKYLKLRHFSRMLTKDWNVLLIVVTVLVIMLNHYVKIV